MPPTSQRRAFWSPEASRNSWENCLAFMIQRLPTAIGRSEPSPSLTWLTSLFP